MLHKILLLQLVNEIPEHPAKNDLNGYEDPTDSADRCLSIKLEARLALCFAFLAARTDDPRKVVAACIKENVQGDSCTVLVASNHGTLEVIEKSFRKIADILERTSRQGM